MGAPRGNDFSFALLGAGRQQLLLGVSWLDKCLSHQAVDGAATALKRWCNRCLVHLHLISLVAHQAVDGREIRQSGAMIDVIDPG